MWKRLINEVKLSKHFVKSAGLSKKLLTPTKAFKKITSTPTNNEVVMIVGIYANSKKVPYGH